MDSTTDLTIPVTLQTEIRAVAAIVRRPADDIVREALELYLAHQHAGEPRPDARRRAEAIVRMREQRASHILPPGVTIEDAIAWGRDGRA